MQTKANWFVDDVVDDDTDPFAERVEQRATPVNLRASSPDLYVELVALVQRDAALYEAGVRCGIRERKDTCCSACPIRNQRADRRELCEIGVAQERIVTTLAVELDAQD